MQQANQLKRFLGLLSILIAFSLPQVGRTQIALTEEFEGEIKEIKPARLFHPVLDTTSTGLDPKQESDIKRLIGSTTDITLKDAFENIILLDLYFEEDYAEVINEARGYIDKYPDGDPVFRPHILFVLAESYYYLKNYNEAKDIYREIRDNHSRFSEVYPHARHGLAWAYMHLGRHEEASEEFYNCGVTPELTVSTLFGYGINKYNEGVYREAVEYFTLLYDGVRYKEEEAMFQLDPRAKKLADQLLARDIFYLGMAYYRLNDLDSAVIYAKMVSNDYSHDSIAPIATYQTAWWSFQNAAYDQAIEYFNKALKVVSALKVINQDSGSIRLLRAQAYYNAGSIPSAMDAYRTIIQDTSTEVSDRMQAEEGLDACYAFIADSAFRDLSVKEDSIARLLGKYYANELGKSPNLAYYEIRFASEYYENMNYDKVLEWTSKALAIIGNQVDEYAYDIYEARKLRIFTFKETEKWDDLAREADLFMKTLQEGQVTEAHLSLLIFMAGSNQERGNALYNAGDIFEGKKAFKAAIPLYERWLKEAPESWLNEAPAGHPTRREIEKHLEYCRDQTK
ncbi:tetratricopeptide repeat protein [candidate division WOR-3 bacterium]|nr:tetratricopeptide repeat protein [candidate division WOR-3 bacterium]